MEKFNRIYQIWSDYFDLNIASNDWLKKIGFFLLIGQHLNERGKGVWCGNRLLPFRLHLLTIQLSGTGKGEMISLLCNTLNYIYPNSAVELPKDVTPQLLTGGYEERGKKRIFVPGLLATKKIISFGESESVFSEENGFRSLIRNVCDTKGKYALGARKDLTDEGNLEQLETSASILTGTMYDTRIFTKKMFTDGFLQRFFLTNKEFNLEESQELSDRIRNLKQINSELFQKKNKLEELKNEILKINTRVVNFDEGSLEIYNKQRSIFEMEMKKEFATVPNAFSAMNSMLNRTIDMENIIAGILCTINEKHKIQSDDLLFAHDLVRESIFSFRQLMERQFLIDNNEATQKRFRAIKMILMDGAIERPKLLERIKLLKLEGSWDMGMNKTLEYLENLEKTGYIKKKEHRNRTTGGQPTYIYYL